MGTHQELEMFGNQPAYPEKLLHKKESLQNQLINIRGELSQATTVVPRPSGSRFFLRLLVPSPVFLRLLVQKRCLPLWPIPAQEARPHDPLNPSCIGPPGGRECSCLTLALCPLPSAVDSLPQRIHTSPLQWVLRESPKVKTVFLFPGAHAPCPRLLSTPGQESHPPRLCFPSPDSPLRARAGCCHPGGALTKAFPLPGVQAARPACSLHRVFVKETDLFPTNCSCTCIRSGQCEVKGHLHPQLH